MIEISKRRALFPTVLALAVSAFAVSVLVCCLLAIRGSHAKRCDQGCWVELRESTSVHYPPNRYGLYDMAGNVWQWTSDWYRPDYYKQLASLGIVARNAQGPDNPFDPAEPNQSKKVHRGGSYLCTDQYCSRYIVGTRGKGELTTATNHLGFRCVMTPAQCSSRQ